MVDVGPAALSCAPVVTDGRVYVIRNQTDGGKEPTRVLALDAATGTTVWAYDTGKAMSPATVSHGVVAVMALDGVHALDAATGKARWRHAT